MTYRKAALKAAVPSEGRRTPAEAGLQKQSSPRRLLRFLGCKPRKAIVRQLKLPLSTGEASLPQTPSNRRTAKAVLLHWLFSRASRSSPALIVSSLASPLQGGPESFLFGTASSLARSRRAAEQARPILVRHRQFSRLARWAAGRASSSSLSKGGSFAPSLTLPPIVGS